MFDINCYPLAGRKLYSESEIKGVIQKLADQINAFYEEKVSVQKPLVIIGILIGCEPFLSFLLIKLNVPLILHYAQVVSFHGQAAAITPPRVTYQSFTSHTIQGQYLLLVDDIYDTGRSLATLEKVVRSVACHLKIVTLFNKTGVTAKIPLAIDWIGVNVPNQFLIGFGLDYQYLYRNLNAVYALKNQTEIDTLNRLLSLSATPDS